MMTTHWSDRLSAYLDGELTESEYAAANDHLLGCEACRTELDDIRAIQRHARRPAGEAPSSDPWPAIARAARRPRFATATALQLAAGVLLVVSLGGGYWWFDNHGADLGPVDREPVGAAVATDEIRREVETLERRFGELESALDPRTVAAVRESIAALNAALADAESELARDRGNTLIQALVTRVRQQKLRILRLVTTDQRPT